MRCFRFVLPHRLYCRKVFCVSAFTHAASWANECEKRTRNVMIDTHSHTHSALQSGRFLGIDTDFLLSLSQFSSSFTLHQLHPLQIRHFRIIAPETTIVHILRFCCFFLLSAKMFSFNLMSIYVYFFFSENKNVSFHIQKKQRKKYNLECSWSILDFQFQYTRFICYHL